MSKTFRNDYNLDNITTHVERVETCMDCGVELYRHEVQFGTCDDCDDAMFEQEHYDLVEDYRNDGAVDEDDAEAMKWLAGSI